MGVVKRKDTNRMDHCRHHRSPGCVLLFVLPGCISTSKVRSKNQRVDQGAASGDESIRRAEEAKTKLLTTQEHSILFLLLLSTD